MYYKYGSGTNARGGAGGLAARQGRAGGPQSRRSSATTDVFPEEQVGARRLRPTGGVPAAVPTRAHTPTYVSPRTTPHVRRKLPE
ncbi:unnamed protein product, partial [Brenthis ino]